MNYFYVEPEVAGGLGEKTIMDRSVHPPVVRKLHYEFDGWLGDVLLESFPCFILRETASRKLKRIGATGIRFDEVAVTTSGEFEDLHPNQRLPKFHWLQIEGKPGHDDFGIGHDGRLVVSERALEVLRGLGVSHALITEYTS